MADDLPDTILYQCPDCADVTEHKILKAKMGRSSVSGTFQCGECGRVFTGTIRLPRKIEVKVMFSDQDVTEVARTVLMEDEIVQVGDEFDLDDGRHVQITYIDNAEGKRRKSCPAPEVKALWVKSFDILHVKASINDYKRTYPMYLEAEPDDEFTIGMIMNFDTWDAVIHAIKTKTKLMRRGTAEARDIVRIYGKKLNGQRPEEILVDEDEPFDESLYDDGTMDLDE